ncbi:MAG: MBL fold metallo-hydrolase [Ktedonobacteraceae bacterium]|nr:MBL fold metallo-hydrolase [Ktedonobacteraceae bacterium]
MDVDTLRTWLERKQPTTILDVRTTTDRAEWWIPGSMHIDAYAALRAHDPRALSTFEAPEHMPVVAVCVAGVTSLIATEQLSWRGIDAYSLAGGMRAWSLAWNTARVPYAEKDVRIIQVRRTGKGCLSYIIGAGEEAFIVDASLDPQVYLDLVAQQGWQISAVFDTHIHADHLSRSRQLAKRSGAQLFLPEQQRVTFLFTPLHTDDTLTIAGQSLRIVHTPGHTAESACYVLNNHVLFTGDTLSLTGVGRPDLQSHSYVEAQECASQLYGSIHSLLAFPGDTLVLPGHTGEPAAFDGRPIMTTLSDFEARVTIVHTHHDEFVQTLLHHVPAAPLHHDLIIQLNEKGIVPDRDVAELEAGANRCVVS